MATFEVWAPAADRVRVWVGSGTGADDPEQTHEMTARDGGWWRAEVAGGDQAGQATGQAGQAAGRAGRAVDYAYLLDDDPTPLPDPRSAWQPGGVHAPSRRYDQAAFNWSDERWTGRQLAGSVVYEMHVGTFTAEGTFDAAADRLDHLVDLGVDAVSLMPVAAWDGTHGWGYDGTHWYAVHEPYGGPDGLKRFVDACHRRGIAVFLDVVYNHVGPSGAYLHRFGPYFTAHHTTPWGRAINLDGPGSDEVRRYVVDNARAWLGDFHLDGLRLDAVHALRDDRAVHLLEELAVATESLSVHCGRPLSLVAESDLNDPRLVVAREAGGYGLTAQWDDDIHHAVHAALTGERRGYYADFGTLADLAKTLRSAYLHDGTWSSFRDRHHGRPVDTTRVPGHRFVAFVQNHDQVGNRALGDRLSARTGPGLLKVAAALVLTGPYTPMLFMGEEWGASTPWQFFTSYPDAELGVAVRDGRRREFSDYGWTTDRVPDPQDPQTFQRSKLDWSEVDKDPHDQVLDFYRRLIRLRRARPELSDPRLDRLVVQWADAGAERWLAIGRGGLRVLANLGRERNAVPVDGAPVAVLLSSEPGFVFRDREVELAGESVAIVELA